MTDAAILSRSERYPELDALRGLAATVVVLRHFLNIWPYDTMGPYFFLLLRSPLRFFFAAHEAVLLFFLLSGFVLTLPFLRASGTYQAFLTRRICRIYLPYLCALALALIGAQFLSGAIPQLSDWFNLTWTKPITSATITDHVLFIGEYPNGELNTAFWSLVYEMRISIVFPLLFLLSGARGWVSVLLFSLAMSALACTFRSDPYNGEWMVTLHFASLFVVGSLLARNRIEVRDYYRSLSKRWRVGLSVIAVFLIVYGAGPPIVRAWIGDFSDWFIVMGLVWLLVLALSSETLTGILRSSIPQFLGRISYSLYLIHATVLFALVHLSFGHMPLLLLFPVYVGLSIGLAVIMHRYAEVPAIDLGRRLASDLRPQAKSLAPH